MNNDYLIIIGKKKRKLYIRTDKNYVYFLLQRMLVSVLKQLKILAKK